MKGKKVNNNNNNAENGNKIKLPKKKRKIILISVAAVLVSITAISTCLYFFVFNKSVNYFKYFNNFTSENVTKAVCTLTLSEGTYVYKYDSVDKLFITMRSYINPMTGEKYSCYGIASEDKEYCQPVYNSILSMKGDYAIVTKTGADVYSGVYYIGVIHFRGEGIQSPVNVTDFSMTYYESYPQFGFVGDYIYVCGEKDKFNATSPYATVYDYKSSFITNGSDELLEKYRVRQAYDAANTSYYSYLQYDDYFVAYSSDKAYFYNLKTDSVFNGYLETSAGGDYVAFPAFEEVLSNYTREMKIYYFGNGWFGCSATLSQSKAFDGFNICTYEDSVFKYSRAKTDFYNVKTGKSSSVNQINLLGGVANAYSYEYYTEYAAYLSNLTVRDDNGRYEYALPFANPANMIKSGYSLVYFYYLPYINKYKDDTTNYYGYLGETTFCIIDENLDVTLINDAMMPLAYVDEVGIQTSDPVYTTIVGNSICYDKYMNATEIAKYKEGQESYITYYGDANSVISLKNLPNGDEDVVQYYGAATPQGKQIVDYIYKELTPYRGDYCIGARDDGGTTKTYKIDKQGKETLIEDVTCVYQSTYSFISNGKYGLKNYNGDVILEAKYNQIDISETYMCDDGKTLTSYVVAIIDSKCLIYKLG